jgi:hypothetical protein
MLAAANARCGECSLRRGSPGLFQAVIQKTDLFAACNAVPLRNGSSHSDSKVQRMVNRLWPGRPDPNHGSPKLNLLSLRTHFHFYLEKSL